MKIEKYNQVWDIWMESKDRLYKYMKSRFKNEELAKDVTQDVLLKIHKSCCSGKEIENINSWLFQITHNVALDILKKEKRQQNLTQFSNDKDENIWVKISSFLEPMIDFLPEKYALPLKMSDIEGEKQKDIALKLGLGLSATKSRIQRAREMLKNEILTCCNFKLDKNGIPIYDEVLSVCKPLKKLNQKK
ncbi:RNA polymerase sigma (SigZ) subunit [Tenacibaculum adriaticum]|uniref:RNA polymerase sigma (SigZ) subunit n=1 Tax=Tenacibaculum adriaticum TaxID=413713 RepID=A0A5S5DQ44_9FLAO|nr:sigma-70 family RNA polymerase sigma factor [Tenacibaculum adriaticum]TYP98021.1 RNA polymerase sigma (SigZ) subunit [Tenacibaculum adriaticum]